MNYSPPQDWIFSQNRIICIKETRLSAKLFFHHHHHHHRHHHTDVIRRERLASIGVVAVAVAFTVVKKVFVTLQFTFKTCIKELRRYSDNLHFEVYQVEQIDFWISYTANAN
uniref:Uncharacterized protein n=1 Tax=Glossina brevipalpis TaxID=37001 RepID=A0A1A9X1Y6_9MUSC